MTLKSTTIFNVRIFHGGSDTQMKQPPISHYLPYMCHVCHQTCEFKKHWLRFILVFIFAGFPPFNHCSCSTLGRCLLESRSSVSKASLFWIAVEIVTLAVFFIVWAASGDLGLSLLVLFFGIALFLFLHEISS